MSGTVKTALVFGLLLSATVGSANSAVTKSACSGVTTTITKQQKADYAALIATSLGKKVKSASVKINSFMQYENWAIVYAGVPVADPGYFFFDLSSKTPKYKDVWGGIADESEIPDIVKWAKGIGANEKIADCFARTVADS